MCQSILIVCDYRSKVIKYEKNKIIQELHQVDNQL